MGHNRWSATRHYRNHVCAIGDHFLKYALFFREKRRDLIHIGRTKDELTERLLMGCYTKDEDIKFISLNGLQCGKHGTTSYLGKTTVLLDCPLLLYTK